MSRAVAAVCVVLCVMVGAACSGSSNKARPVQGPLDWRGRTHVDVDAESNLFTPPEIIISPGTTVTWHNRDKVAHDVRQAGGGLVDFGGNFGAGLSDFGPGTSYSFTFKKVSDLYFYTCTIHTGMNGRVYIRAGTAATTTVP